MSPKTIAIYTSFEGHASISTAIEQVLSSDYKVVRYQVKDPTFGLYTPLYKFAPFLFGVPFYFLRQAGFLAKAKTFFLHRYQRKVAAFGQKHHPDLLMSMYFMYNPGLEMYAQKISVPFVNILTDPKTLHPLLLSQAATTNIAFDEEAVSICQHMSPSSSVQPFGWFVRTEYTQPYDVIDVRKKLGLRPDVLTFLVVSGSEGTNIVTTILPSLLMTSKPIQVIVACGANKTLYKAMCLLQTQIKKTQSQTVLLPLSFTTELHRYMQAADLVVGKAGPNTLFESVATYTPFFALTHISGQEDGNLDIIRQHHLGYVEENVLKANRLLRAIIKRPQQLEQFQPHLKKMAAYNAQAADKLRSLVKQLIGS